MKLKISIKIDSGRDGTAERIIEKTIPEDGSINSLEELAMAIIDAIPNEHFPLFNVLEIYSEGKLKGHAEK